jgi:signal transduction histidine kinase
MLNTLRKRFVLFSVMVISSILILLGLLTYMGPTSHVSSSRYIWTILLAIGMVFAGSWLLSKAAIRPIKAAWQKQLDFTADASHELRTPIAVIRTTLELLLDSPEETIGSQMKWLKNMEVENLRLAKLVDDLLTLSKADTNQQTIECKTFLLHDVIMDALLPFESIAARKNIVLETSIDDEMLIYGDRKRMEQLLVILLDNAINYSDCPGTIKVSIAQSKSKYKLLVSDTGVGIEEEHLDKIFDRFYRINQTRNKNPDGSGLGLSIAKWIVQEHGGTIEVASSPGNGTTFTIVLPAKKHLELSWVD